MWEELNHQMSEHLIASQGLSPLQPAGDKIQNATVQQAWHVPEEWALAVSPLHCWHHSHPFIPSLGEIWLVCTGDGQQWARYSRLAPPAELPEGSANLTWSWVSTSALYLQRHYFAYQKFSSFHTKAETMVEIRQDFPSHFPITHAIQNQTFPKTCANNTFTTLSPYYLLKGFSVPWYPSILWKLKSTNSVRPQPCKQFHRDFLFKRENHGVTPKKKPQVLKSYE